ncbi:hypothetical protein ACFVVX_05010 [Kitasatospora sp. NPDC058170]|uniref:hypothetical protein n=1 Tax=Kitasatospora sp. NPDC058170 TaxID=3346364 RepID=UPI0036D91939
MQSRTGRHARQRHEDARAAVAELTDALASASIVLPSVGVDSPSLFTGEVLVELGRARPDVVIRLAALIRRGTDR